MSTFPRIAMILMALATLGNSQAQEFSGPSSEKLNFECRASDGSTHYRVFFSDDKNPSKINYAIGDYVNDGAEVAAESFYNQERVLLATINVDGIKKFVINAYLIGATYKGFMWVYDQDGNPSATLDMTCSDRPKNSVQ